MAKLSFHKDVWHVNDPEWVSKREAQWLELLPKYCGVDKNETAARKSYFVKGTFTPGAKYEPSAAHKVLMCPVHTQAIFDEIFGQVESDWQLKEQRASLLVSLHSQYYYLSYDNFGHTKDILAWLLVGASEYSEKLINVNGFDVPQFPVQHRGGTGGSYFWLFVSSTLKWLKLKSANPDYVSRYLLNHFFSVSETLTDKDLSWEAKVETLYEFFLHIQHFIAPYPTNSAVDEKKAFVKAIKDYVSTNGWSHPKVAELWQQAAEDNETSDWAEEPNVIPTHKLKNVHSSKGALAQTNVIRLPRNQKANLLEELTFIYQENDFHLQQFDLANVRRVDLAKLLSEEFKIFVGLDAKEFIHGFCIQFFVNENITKSIKATIKIELIQFDWSGRHDESVVPVLMLLERTNESYDLRRARRYIAHRKYLYDAIKDKLGYTIERFYGASSQRIPLVIPPQTGSDLERSQLQLEMPFIDEPFYPTVTGPNSLLDKPEFDLPVVEGQSYADYIKGS